MQSVRNKERQPLYKPSLSSIVLGLIPFVGMCFSVPLWDRIYPMLLGLPFNLFWLIAWILISSTCMAAAYGLEESREARRSREHLDNRSSE
jgi:hypothetical protein